MSKRDNTGQSEIMLKVGEDLVELHLRREIERMCLDQCRELYYYDGEYHIFKLDALDFELEFGPYTLQQCHDKLRELSGEDT
jgi:hypothetical protein